MENCIVIETAILTSSFFVIFNLRKWDGGTSTYAFDDILLTGDEGGVGESKLIIDMSVMNVKCFVLISENKHL